MASIIEIAPDVFRIETFVEAAGIGFSQFLIRDEAPLLYHTGQNAIFPGVRDAVASLIPLETLRYVGFSHFEADESGALAQWLALAPKAQPVTSVLGAATNVGDVTDRAPRIMADDEVLVTGHHELQFLATPYVPHSWDASLLFDRTTRTLFCSDLFVQRGRLPAVDAPDAVLERALAALRGGQEGPFHDALPYTTLTRATFQRLADLAPECLGVMHGSCTQHEGARLLTAFHAELAALHGVAA